MFARHLRCVLAASILSSILLPSAVFAQGGPPPGWQPFPTYLSSLEAITADSKVLVRGVIVDLDSVNVKEKYTPYSYYTYSNSNQYNPPSIPVEHDVSYVIVTVKVLDVLKGDRAELLKFAVRLSNSAHINGSFNYSDPHLQVRKLTSLREWRKSKEEVLCFLRGCEVAEFKSRLIMLEAHGASEFGMGVCALGAPESHFGPPIFSVDLQLLKTARLLQGARAAVDFENKRKPANRNHALRLPSELFEHADLVPAQTKLMRSGEYYLTVPVDERLEGIARRLIENPQDAMKNALPVGRKLSVNGASLQRMDAAKALRLFRSEQNLALLRAWLDDSPAPTRSASEKIRAESLLPPSPVTKTAVPRLAADLAAVPEVHFQKPLSKTLSVPEAQLRTACTIDMIHYLNRQKRDSYMEALVRRPDLAGLPFAMGDACRLDKEASKHFVQVRKDVASAINQKHSQDTPVCEMMDYYHLDRSRKGKNPAAVHAEVEVAALMQMLAVGDSYDRLRLAELCDGEHDAEATRALAKLAIFSPEENIRRDALRSLRLRRDRDYTEVLLTGLHYPWPSVAERAAEAIVQLGRSDLEPHLAALASGPDPRAPRRQTKGGKSTTVVRELVRINHHHNCLLCHAPAPAQRDNLPEPEAKELAPLTAQIPVPSEAMNAYYSPRVPDILVRFDVTYLRQDFSMNLPVADAAPWPQMQRYDFVVRTREVTDEEAAAWNQLLPSASATTSPYQRLAQSALERLRNK